MQVFFIEKSSKINLIKKVKLENDKITISKNYNKIKIVKKIVSLLNKYGCNVVIIDKELKEDKVFCNLLYSNQIEIIDGKKLFKKLILQILDFILEEKNLDIHDVKISILQNDSSIKMIENIIEKIEDIKNINIVTNNPQYFKALKKKMYEEKGFIITLTSNKRKSLLKSDIIFNIDFPEEMINKYIINDNAIIVNFEEKIMIMKKRFNGRIINNYLVKLKQNTNIANSLQKDKFKRFDLKDLAECYIINNPGELQNIIISM